MNATTIVITGLLLAGAFSVLLPTSEAKTCSWGYGPLDFECTGDSGCLAGAGFTFSGTIFVGCTAWD